MIRIVYNNLTRACAAKNMNEVSKHDFLTRPRKSAFVRKFTKTPPGIVCPHFYILAHANGCPYSCDYCFLQLTFRHMRKPTVFSNRHDLLRDVRQFLALKEPSLLNAGKLCDALAFDDETRLSKDLVPLFAGQNRHKLLFLTKSTNVQNLLDIPEHRNTVVAFSVNAPELAHRFEHAAPSPYERIKAAKACQDAGYEVRLKIDPVIPVSGWKQYYLELVNEIMEVLKAEDILITFGSIRYFKSLPRHARARGRNVTVFDVATSRDGTDGRMRVAPDLRFEIYSWFREQFPQNVSLSLCKESEEVWQKLGWNHTPSKCNCAL